MHRIDTPTAQGGMFTEGDPSIPIPPTNVGADWLNAVQEEIAAVVVAGGVALDKADNNQMAVAIQNLIAPAVAEATAAKIAAQQAAAEAATAAVEAAAASATPTVITSATKVVPAGYMGEFGSGLWRVFTESSSFTVPTGVTSIRVRVVGAGGYSPPGGGGGGGCGYSHGVFSVTAGTTYAVTVAPEAQSGAGGTSSFGALISATGGQVGLTAAPYTGGAGGIGVGGDFQATGGTGGKGYTGTKSGGGGGAGSQLGDGGDGGNAYSASETGAGGGIVGHASNPIYGSGSGGSPFGNACGSKPGPDITGGTPADGVFSGASNPLNAVIRFPFDGFTGGGGMFRGGAVGGIGGIGGGGGGGSITGYGGVGGGSSGGGGGQIVTNTAYGAGGLVVVEW